MNEFYNTIILKHGVGSYSKKQFNNFTEGDCICGENASPEELKRWTGDQYDLAKASLLNIAARTASPVDTCLPMNTRSNTVIRTKTGNFSMDQTSISRKKKHERKKL